MFRLYFQRMPETSPVSDEELEELLELLDELLELEELLELLDELLILEEMLELLDELLILEEMLELEEGADGSPPQPASNPAAAATAAPFIKSRREILHFIDSTSHTRFRYRSAQNFPRASVLIITISRYWVKQLCIFISTPR